MAEKVPRTPAELEQELNDQLELLKLDAKNYDAGTEIAAKSMAAKLRLLFHDGGSCHSLLRQTDKSDVLFYDTAQEIIPHNPFAYSGLIVVNIHGANPKYVAPLDNITQQSARQISFGDWWNAIVFKDQEHNEFSRKDLVRSLADQDGGAHVDPGLDKKYHALAKRNTLGWHGRPTGGTWKPLANPHYAAVRQITHEALKSLLPAYISPIKTLTDGIYLGGISMEIATPSFPLPVPPMGKVGRNDPCPCSSGKKYKKCHGK
jgi:SEC-C motif